MSGSNERPSDPASSDQANRQQPLVIVAEHGRRTEASRRLVRAQAARASAAQSRVTRARNRGERDGTQRESVQPPQAQDAADTTPLPSLASQYDPSQAIGQKPLAAWLPSVVTGLANSATSQVANLDSGSSLPFASPTGQTGSFSSLLSQVGTPSDSMLTQDESGKFRLPVALPRGFAALQQRLDISDTMIGLLSRTACVDFASPGVEARLHQLLFDLIVKAGTLGLISQSGHPIQGHLRVAATCLTIFQGQRANGAVFAQDRKYNIGLEAAWSEATLLDRSPLAEPKSAEASLWAVFIISVTTGAMSDFFHQQLHALLRDLQLRYWEQVRRVLLDFIYPVSFLDEPCKMFYDSLGHAPIAAG